MLHALSFLLVFYGVFLALLYYFQRRLIYHPVKAIAAPERYGLHGFSEHFINSIDHQSLQLWHRPAAEGFPTIAYFHGNAGHVGERAALLAALAGKGFGVAALSYRGYGKSTGSPSESGLYSDARATMEFVTQQCGIPLARTILFGESLGTGVAVQMALEYDIAMIALQAPYRSVAGRAAEIYFFIPVKLLIKDKFDSLRKITKVKAPLIVFHGELDDVIPIEHGKSVLAAATCPKQGFFFPHNGHNDFDTAAISEHVLDYAEKYNLINR